MMAVPNPAPIAPWIAAPRVMKRMALLTVALAGMAWVLKERIDRYPRSFEVAVSSWRMRRAVFVLSFLSKATLAPLASPRKRASWARRVGMLTVWLICAWARGDPRKELAKSAAKG